MNYFIRLEVIIVRKNDSLRFLLKTPHINKGIFNYLSREDKLPI